MVIVDCTNTLTRLEICSIVDLLSESVFPNQGYKDKEKIHVVLKCRCINLKSLTSKSFRKEETTEGANSGFSD